MKANLFTPGTPWPDAAGKHIQAHGGGIIRHDGVWYWYGEDKSSNTGHNQTGVSAYASTDLLNWRHLGVVLPKDNLPPENRDNGACERPKVLYSAKTKCFVMWMHLEDRHEYSAAAAGIATAERPEGPFTFVRKGRPIQFDFGYPEKDWTKQAELGNTYRDMTLFQDDDGQAYAVYASEDNATLYAVQLNDDYTWAREPAVKGRTWERIVVGEFREAPALFKFRGRYYMFSSGTTGWQPNPGRVHTAPHILGPWTSLGDPCHGRGAETNYRSQPTCVLALPGAPEGSFIYLADRWDWHNLRDSRYVWLPFVMNAAAPDSVRLDFYERWELDVFTRKPAPPALVEPPVAHVNAEGGVELRWPPVNGADGYYIYEGERYLGHTVETTWTTGRYAPEQAPRFSVRAHALTGGLSAASPQVQVPIPLRPTVRLGDIAPTSWSQGYGEYRVDRSVVSHDFRTNGKTYAFGVGTHCPGRIVYDLARPYTRITGLAGMNDTSWPNVEVRFRILGDGRELYLSRPVRKNQEPAAFDVSLLGVKQLVLEANSTTASWDGCHADWLQILLHT